MNRRKIILIAAGAILFIFVVTVLINNPKNKVTVPTDSEGPGTVIIDNTSGLRNILLQKQYIVSTKALNDYIQTKVDQKADHATIVGNPTVMNNGNVSFRVRVDGNSKELEVILDRSQFDKIIFSVPASNYSVTLNTYKSN